MNTLSKIQSHSSLRQRRVHFPRVFFAQTLEKYYTHPTYSFSLEKKSYLEAYKGVSACTWLFFWCFLSFSISHTQTLTRFVRSHFHLHQVGKNYIHRKYAGLHSMYTHITWKTRWNNNLTHTISCWAKFAFSTKKYFRWRVHKMWVKRVRVQRNGKTRNKPKCSHGIFPLDVATCYVDGVDCVMKGSLLIPNWAKINGFVQRWAPHNFSASRHTWRIHLNVWEKRTSRTWMNSRFQQKRKHLFWISVMLSFKYHFMQKMLRSICYRRSEIHP